jgi:predicted phosphodiesterase
MKIRVISDLHINLLQKKFIPLYKKDNILTLIAGDISLNPSQTYKYVSKNFNDAILIGGNHLFYSNVPIEIKHQVLHEYFPMNSNQVFLEREYKVIDNYVVIGATF